MYYEISVLHAYIFPFTGLHYKALFFIFKYLALHLVSFLCLFIIRFMDCICDCGTKAIRLISHTAFLNVGTLCRRRRRCGENSREKDEKVSILSFFLYRMSLVLMSTCF